MTDDTTDLTPALTPEQWKFEEWRDDDSFILALPASAMVTIGSRDSEEGYILDGAAMLLAVSALSNHALPDDHEGKLTWAHVELVESFIDEHWEDTANALRALSAALRTRLPPRPAGGALGWKRWDSEHRQS